MHFHTKKPEPQPQPDRIPLGDLIGWQVMHQGCKRYVAACLDNEKVQLVSPGWTNVWVRARTYTIPRSNIIGRVNEDGTLDRDALPPGCEPEVVTFGECVGQVVRWRGCPVRVCQPTRNISLRTLDTHKHVSTRTYDERIPRSDVLGPLHEGLDPKVQAIVNAAIAWYDNVGDDEQGRLDDLAEAVQAAEAAGKETT